MKRIVFIGFGAMAHEALRRLPTGISLAGVIVPPARVAAVQEELGAAVQVASTVDHVQQAPDLVLECAGHAGLGKHGPAVLERGWPLAVVSVGALADDALLASLRAAATRGGVGFRILSGAVAGMDGLSAAREGGLDEVLYVARKAPRSWRGSPAETLIDLEAVQVPTVFFEGSAGEAARLFPANANVAATIALCGIGMQRTRVQLLVDPQATRNTHRIQARGAFGQMQIELAGQPLPGNPKTSMLAALSIVRACRQLLEPISL